MSNNEENDDDTTENPGNYALVAAIDFGTMFSGYGFSFRNSQNDIKLNKNWGNLGGFLSYKAPTCVLLNEKDNLLSFGYEAEELFVDEDDEDSEQSPKYFLENFKMVLHGQRKITRNTIIKSIDGHIFKAIDVFTNALKYLKDHFLEQLLQETGKKPIPDLIRWVVTVPAIWSDESKQFMREAAFLADMISYINSSQLIIALEPEAASFYCRQLDLQPFASKEVRFPAGTRYLVLDCGGGTNDMVVHEIVFDQKVKELCAVNGGDAGGHQVNKKFESLLKDIFGAELIDTYQKRKSRQWLSFIKKFEHAKKRMSRDPNGKMRIELLYEINREYEHISGNSFASLQEDVKRERGIVFKNGILVLPNAVVRKLFRDTIKSIVKVVQDVLENTQFGASIQYILMVGGFSECKYLQDAIRGSLRGRPANCAVLVPEEAQLAIIKGAVLYGHYQGHVVSRIARRTYGVNCTIPFNSDLHPEHRAFIDENGDKMCSTVLSVFVKMGEEIELNRCVGKEGTITKSQNQIRVGIYSLSRKPNQPVEFVDNKDIIKVGRIIIDTPNPNALKERRASCKMYFGSTEILVKAIDMSSQNKYITCIDFLEDM